MLNFKILQNLRFLPSGIYLLKRAELEAFQNLMDDTVTAMTEANTSKVVNTRQGEGYLCATSS